MSDFLISICIPAYNHPHLLKRCLQSIIYQKYRNFEVIVTDDSRHDLLKIVVEEFNDDRIKYFKNLQPLGSPQNWNYCISKAIGSVIKILHHDDWFYDQDCLSGFIEIFEKNPDIHFVFSQCYNITPLAKKLFAHSRSTFKYVIKYPELLLFANWIGAPSNIAVSKNVVSNIQFDKNSSWYVDVIYYIDVLKTYKNISYIEFPLVNITSGSHLQVTNTTPGIQKFEEALYVFEKYYSFKNHFFKFLLLCHFIELFKKYKIEKLGDLQELINSSKLKKIWITAYKFSRLPVNYKCYAFLRLVILKCVYFFKVTLE